MILTIIHQCKLLLQPASRRLILSSIILTTVLAQQNVHSEEGVLYTPDDYIQASHKLGKWFNRSFGHYDFFSPTPMALARKGDKFFIIEKPKMQTASDFGFSIMKAHLNNDIKNAYKMFGYDPVLLPETMDAYRIHYAFSIKHLYDFSLSYLQVPNSKIRGFGIGHQELHKQWPLFFYSAWAVKFSRVQAENFFTSHQLLLDYSVSVYLFLLDLYGGIRYGLGHSKFEATIEELKMDDYFYASNLNEANFYYGVQAILTTNVRLNMEINQISNEKIYALKLSLYFNSLLPKLENPLRNPGYMP